MSQKGSSLGSENPEFKYKKALLEIQKIHNANKELKRQSEEMKMEFERQILDSHEHLHELDKECEGLKEEKAEIQKYYEECRLSHTDLEDSNNNLKREVKYLNDALNDQNEQLKKVEALKSEKGLSSLITSYEDRQLTYRNDISRLEQMNKNVKANFDVLDSDLNEQRRERYKLQDMNNNYKMEMVKYRELNHVLLGKNESIVFTLLNRSTEGKEKFREAESMLYELSRQLEMVKTTRIEQHGSHRTTVSIENYEVVLQEKGKLENDVLKLREKLEEYDDKARGAFEVEEKMKREKIRAEMLQEECNMLKGKLIVIETKDIMDGEMEFGDFKDLEERLLTNIGQNDPLMVIKNGSDSSHFQLMKSYILELKEKLSKAVVSRREYEKKYRSLKEKLTEKAEKSIGFDEQNKLLKGKVEGYERLTERLQFELQKNIEVHEQEITKMKNVTNSIVAKKTDEVKVANAYIRAQLDFELDKFEKTEKGIRQELDTVKLELSTEKIKNVDLQEKYTQSSQFLSIYERKFSDITASNEEVEENNQALNENVTKYEQLYRDERSNNEILLGQKSTLTNRLAQISDQLDRKIMSEEDMRDRFEGLEGEAKRTKFELTQTKSEFENLQILLKTSKKEFEDKSRVAMLDISKTEAGYYTTLESSFAQEREKSRELEGEIQSLRLRLERTMSVAQRFPQLEDQLNQKNDELNDFKRKAIMTEKQVNVQEVEMRDIKNQFDLLRRENSELRAKLLESGQEMRRSYESKDIDGKKATQRINEELTSALSELREERRVNARLQTDVQSYRSEVDRLSTSVEQSKTKQLHYFDEMGQLKSSLQGLTDENERLRSEIKYKSSTIEGLNSDLAGIQEKMFKITQESSDTKFKKQQFENDLAELKREITGLKVYMSEVENYGNTKVASGNWQEQRERENVANFVQKVKRIMKKAEYNSAGGSTGGDYRPVTYAATPSYVPDYLKSYNEPLFQGYAGSYKSSDLDMKVTEFPVPAASDGYGTFKNIETRVGDYS